MAKTPESSVQRAGRRRKSKVGVQSELRCYGVTVSAVPAVDTVKMYLMSQCTRIYFARIYFATLNVSI